MHDLHTNVQHCCDTVLSYRMEYLVDTFERTFWHRYKYHAAMIFDSAAAFFGRDNVGLCGIAHFFKVYQLSSHVA